MKLLLIATAAALAVSACPTHQPVSYAETSAAAARAASLVQSSDNPAAAQQIWEQGNEAYLTWNGARRGWSTTESGLQYRRVGRAHPNAAQPADTDTVKVHYRGSFIDGREFDSSYSRNEPTSFPLNRVIKGWTEGVALMREGETFEFVIPQDLAYGQRWVGGKIPPKSTLLFTVELIAVNPQD